MLTDLEPLPLGDKTNTRIDRRRLTVWAVS